MTQRRPQAGQECTKRKHKCDKHLPCSRCRRLILDCGRGIILLRRLLTKNADDAAQGIQQASESVDEFRVG
ncbi:hypothetical protein BJ546DRAFT_1019742 [Cryomyces antarcticus]